MDAWTLPPPGAQGKKTVAKCLSGCSVRSAVDALSRFILPRPRIIRPRCVPGGDHREPRSHRGAPEGRSFPWCSHDPPEEARRQGPPIHHSPAARAALARIPLRPPLRLQCPERPRRPYHPRRLRRARRQAKLHTLRRMCRPGRLPPGPRASVRARRRGCIPSTAGTPVRSGGGDFSCVQSGCTLHGVPTTQASGRRLPVSSCLAPTLVAPSGNQHEPRQPMDRAAPELGSGPLQLALFQSI